MSSASATDQAKAGLLRNFAGAADQRGYTRTAEDNLLPNVDFAAVKGDLARGRGRELKSKFRAVHSSSALAVNCFGPFKKRPADLILLGAAGAKNLEFEKPLTIFRGGTPPNIDVWIVRDGDTVGVESKLLEYLEPKKPAFSSAYDRLKPPKSDPRWWEAYQDTKEGVQQHLDRAQLIKHAFGLDAFRKKSPEVPRLSLLYLFWEPLNWREVVQCTVHREELGRFAEIVSGSEIAFHWATYHDLWEAWLGAPELAEHSRALKARYEVEL